MIRSVARMLAFTLLASTLLMGSEGEPGRHKKHAAKPKGPTVEEQLQQLKDQLNQQQDQMNNSRITSKLLSSSSSRTTRRRSNRISNCKLQFKRPTKKQQPPKIQPTR